LQKLASGKAVRGAVRDIQAAVAEGKNIATPGLKEGGRSKRYPAFVPSYLRLFDSLEQAVAAYPSAPPLALCR